MPSRRLCLVLSLLAACAKPPPSPPPPPAPSAAPVASAAPSASAWTPRDPREIRCGLDDRPKSVISLRGLLPPDDASRLVIRARVPQEMKPTPQGPRRPRTPRPPQPPPPSPSSSPPSTDTPNPFAPGARILLPDIDQDQVPDIVDVLPVRLLVDRLPITLVNGSPPASPLAQALGAVDPQYDACIPLEREGETLGPITFDLELASSGSPLRVLPPASSGHPTPLVRCLMERACQLQATASPPQETTRVQVPLRLRRPEPAAPPPPPPVFSGRLDVVNEAPDGGFAEAQLQLRVIVGEAARSCGPVPGRTSVRLAISLVPDPSATSLSHTQFVSLATPRLVSGKPPETLFACLGRSLEGRSFEVPVAMKRRDRVLVTWNP